MFLVSNGLLATSYCQIGIGYKSDHSPMELSLMGNDVERGPGIWKLNTSLLQEKEYVDGINKLLEVVKIKYHELNAKDKWDCIKKDIQMTTDDYAKNKAEKRKDLHNLMMQQSKLQNKLDGAHTRLRHNMHRWSTETCQTRD